MRKQDFVRKRKRLLFIGFIILLTFCFSELLAQQFKLTEADWAKLKKGELVKEVKREGGTQNSARSAGVFNYPPDLIWKVICSLELYDEYMTRTTKSLLLDEKTKEQVISAGDKSADEIEKLFVGMESGYVKREPDGQWTVYSYQRNSFPWPVNDRWVLLRDYS